jgi:hypothetical protein
MTSTAPVEGAAMEVFVTTITVSSVGPLCLSAFDNHKMAQPFKENC